MSQLRPSRCAGRRPAVIQLRNQLIARGYLNQTASGLYDQALLRAVQRFQLDSGITADGIAGAATIAALNVPVTGSQAGKVCGWVDFDKIGTFNTTTEQASGRRFTIVRASPGILVSRLRGG